MLRKSLKHEFRATTRVMLPILIALVVLSVIAHFSILLMQTYKLPWFLNTIGGAFIALFVVGIIAACVGVIVLTVIRFYRSFLSDEGYLNMTLPVSVHTHISSRLIVSVVWYTLAGIAAVACFLVMILDAGGWKDVFFGFGDIFRAIAEEGLTGHAIVLGVEYFVLVVLGSAFSSLMLYAALSVGHSFNRGKKGFSVLFAFVFYHVTQLLTTLAMIGLSTADWTRYLDKFDNDPLAVIPFMESFVGIMILILLALCAVFYFITHRFLTKKLNLE